MNATKTSEAKGKKRLLLAASAVVVIGLVGAFALTRAVGSDARRGNQPTFRVKRGPLLISVVESGTIKSQEQVSLKSEVEGQTTLIFLIPEGTPVKKDDLLVELDASKLQDDQLQQQIAVDRAEAAQIQATQSLAVAQNQAESDISKAELDYRFAQEDVKQYVEGQHPKEIKEAEANIELASEDWKRAKEKLAWSERLYAEKYISLTELEADGLTENRTKLNHELAVAELDLLEDYTSKRKLDELDSNVSQMKMALERVKLKANADIVQAQADLKAKETELTQQKVKLDKIDTQLIKTKIFAPRDGLVVYATSVQSGRHRQEPLEEGQAVRERQELIYLPSADSMMAEVQIHESSLEKVRVGQPVRVKVDALPGKIFNGRVTKIAPLPDAQSAWLNPDLKVYPTEIALDTGDGDSNLRTGMNCQAEIIVEQHADALYVPMQAVLRVGNVPTVFLSKGGSIEAQPIEIGLDNNSMVHVLAGLDAGQEVLLTPPLDAAAEREAPQLALVDTEAKGVTQAADVQPVPAPADAPQPDARRAEGEEGRGRSPFGNMTPEQREEMRKRFQNMTPEEREAMRRQRMENMTPEQRAEFERRRQERQSEGGGDRRRGGSE